MDSERTIKLIESADGKRRVEIMARADDHFRFVEFFEDEDFGETYWAPAYFSGIYDDPGSAEQDARAQIPWLHDQGSN